MKKDQLISFRTTSENQVYLQKLAKGDKRSISFIIDLMIEAARNLKIKNIRKLINMKELVIK